MEDLQASTCLETTYSKNKLMFPEFHPSLPPSRQSYELRNHYVMKPLLILMLTNQDTTSDDIGFGKLFNFIHWV